MCASHVAAGLVDEHQEAKCIEKAAKQAVALAMAIDTAIVPDGEWAELLDCCVNGMKGTR